MSNPYNLPVLNVNAGITDWSFIISSPIIHFTKVECQNIIKQALADQHSITKFEWDDDRCCYNIGYKTKPYEYELGISETQYYLKKHIAIETAMLAREMFSYEPQTYVRPHVILQWCEFEIRLVWNENTNSIYMICSPIKGDSLSLNILAMNINDYAIEKHKLITGLIVGLIEGYCVETCNVCKQYNIPPKTNVTCKCYNNTVSYIREYLTRDFV